MNQQNTLQQIRIGILGMTVVFLVIAFPVFADFKFGTPKNCGPTVNTAFAEGTPSISGNGLTLYFGDAPWKPVPGGHGGVDIRIATRIALDQPWDSVTNPGSPLNTPHSDGSPNISFDGLSLFFSSDRPGGRGDMDLWVSTRPSLNSTWNAPVNLGATVNSSHFEAMPCISNDGLALYFYSSGRPDGLGSGDLWVTRRSSPSETWGPPENLGPNINSPEDDGWPCLLADGLTLIFNSNRPGGLGSYDLHASTRATADEQWRPSFNLGKAVNSPDNDGAPSVSADGQCLLLHSARPGGQGDLDLWQTPIVPVVDFNNDDQVDAKDLCILVNHWHSSDPLCDIGPTPWGDGIVDFQDLKVLSEYLEAGFGRIAHWKLDETEGDVAYDSIGLDNANVHGEAAWRPDAGAVDGALELDGVDDYIAPMLILNPMDRPFRIIAWVKGGAPGQVIASQTADEFRPGSAYLAADPDNGTLLTGMMLSNMPLDSDVAITDDEWHEVGFEWDGERRHLMVNDEEVAVDEVTLPALDYTGYLNIGTGPDTEPGSFWSGLIDDVRVYEKGGGSQ